eukprot:9490630-Pyramimonas_sp.AAC.1
MAQRCITRVYHSTTQPTISRAPGRSTQLAMAATASPRLSRPRAFDVKSGERVVVPQVDVFSAGFTCTTQSNLNSKTRGQRLSPVQTGEGDTGLARRMPADYIQKARPPIVILENLTALMNEAEPGVCADSVAICEFLRSCGYSARAATSGVVRARD